MPRETRHPGACGPKGCKNSPRASIFQAIVQAIPACSAGHPAGVGKPEGPGEDPSGTRTCGSSSRIDHQVVLPAQRADEGPIEGPSGRRALLSSASLPRERIACAGPCARNTTARVDSRRGDCNDGQQLSSQHLQWFRVSTRSTGGGSGMGSHVAEERTCIQEPQTVGPKHWWVARGNITRRLSLFCALAICPAWGAPHELA